MRKVMVFLAVMSALGSSAYLGSSAHTMRDAWIDMPDSLVMYLNKSVRTELADYVDMKVAAATRNSLGDTTRIDTLATDYIDVSLSETSRLEMKLLRREGGDSIICLVRTYYGPAAESTISFYGLDWQPLEGSFVPADAAAGLMAKPDSLAEEEFNRIKEMVDPRMTEMRLSPGDQSLTLSCSIPEVSKEDECLIKGILVKKKLNWNGATFN